MKIEKFIFFRNFINLCQLLLLLLFQFRTTLILYYFQYLYIIMNKSTMGDKSESKCNLILENRSQQDIFK